MARLIKANGEVTEVHPKNGETFSAEEIHRYVDGYFEMLHSQTRQKFIFIDDEGKIKNKQLNDYISTQLHFEGTLSKRDYIVGDVLECDYNEVD